MSNFKLANVDLLPTFITNLQNLILAKHEGTKASQEPDYLISFETGDAEVAEKQLPVTPPAAKKGEYCFQVKLYKENNETGVIGFCKANFDNPDADEEKVWGKVKIMLVNLTDNKSTLDKGLKDRKIHMGFSSSYLRKSLGEEENWGKWIKKGNGYSQSHWHFTEDFDLIVKKRVEQAKKVKLATKNDKNEKEDPEDLGLYCGDLEAPIQVCHSGEWKTMKNSKVIKMKSEARKNDYENDEKDDFYYSGSYYSRASSRHYYNVPMPGRGLPLPPPAEVQLPEYPYVPNYPPP